MLIPPCCRVEEGLSLSLGLLWFTLFLQHCGINLFNLSDQELLVMLFLLNPDKCGLKDGLIMVPEVKLERSHPLFSMLYYFILAFSVIYIIFRPQTQVIPSELILNKYYCIIQLHTLRTLNMRNHSLQI